MEAEKKKHTGVYLPADLLRRLAQYQVDKAGRLYGRNEIIIQAIEEFLKNHKH
jgi:metal-responsive CopG/Arc/MetJ family transcriptional regulator